MSLLEAIFLGIIQGATEFLPVSSSGHTVLIPTLFNMDNPNLSLISIAHQGTLLAVLIYFFRDLWNVLLGVWRGIRCGHPLSNPESRLGWYIILGSIPAAVAGLTLESYFEQVFAHPVFTATFLFVTALLLFTGERLLSGQKEMTGVSAWDAFIVGVFQMFALFPGISRSGSTITGGLLRGLDRETAARFSFLLGVPAIFGAGLLAIFDISRDGLATQWPIYLGTFVASAVTGYLCIHLLLTWLRNHSLYPFAAYCAIFGSIYLLLAWLGWV